jgi:hypothetical protein
VRIRSVFTHATRGVLVAVLVIGLTTGTAVARKPVPGGGTGSGSCWATPNPVAVGANYTLTGTGLGAYAIVNVLISDSGGTTSFNLQADGSGRTAVTWHSYWRGTSSVRFQQSTRNGYATVASCAFSVV